MNAIAAPKISTQNRLEGFALTFLLQGFPTFAGAALPIATPPAASCCSSC